MSRVVEVYLCRHGETTANRDDILQGHCDYELTENGTEAAKRTGKFFGEQNVVFDRVRTCRVTLTRLLNLFSHIRFIVLIYLGRRKHVNLY